MCGRIQLLRAFSELILVKREEKGTENFQVVSSVFLCRNIRCYEMIPCHFRMLLKLKRENTSNFGNSYPTSATAFNLGSHPLSLSSLTGFVQNYLFSELFPQEQFTQPLDRRHQHGICARAKLEPQPLRVRTAPPRLPPPPPKLQRRWRPLVYLQCVV